MWNKPKPVIAHYVQTKENIIFESATACAEYYTLAGHKLFAETVKRLINGEGLWQYKENGKTIQIIFDELLTPENVKEETENGE